MLAESDYLPAGEPLDRQIEQLVQFERRLANVSFAVPLNIDLTLFNLTTHEPFVSEAVQCRNLASQRLPAPGCSSISSHTRRWTGRT